MPNYNVLPKTIPTPKADYINVQNLKIGDDNTAIICLIKVYNYYQSAILSVESELLTTKNEDDLVILAEVIDTYKNSVSLLSQTIDNVDEFYLQDALNNEINSLSASITLEQQEIEERSCKLQKIQNRINELQPVVTLNNKAIAQAEVTPTIESESKSKPTPKSKTL